MDLSASCMSSRCQISSKPFPSKIPNIFAWRKCSLGSLAAPASDIQLVTLACAFKKELDANTPLSASIERTRALVVKPFPLSARSAPSASSASPEETKALALAFFSSNNILLADVPLARWYSITSSSVDSLSSRA